MSATNGQERVTKMFSVFDCDAHINDPDEIWSKYVEPKYRDLVRQSYWSSAARTTTSRATTRSVSPARR
jgi:hypothetical protein